MKKIITIFIFLSTIGFSASITTREDIIKEIIEKTYIDNEVSKSLEKLKTDSIGYTDGDEENDNFVYFQNGKASFYGERWNGKKTANGDIFNTSLLTAAHKTLPFGTIVKVTNEDNGKSVIVKINDRGPFIKGRVIDLTKAAFSSIESINKGVTKVKLEIIGK